MKWHTQAGSITTNLKLNIDFTLPELSATKIVTWNCHVDDSAKGIYDIILGRYIWTGLGLNLKLSDSAIESNDGTFEGSLSPMFDLLHDGTERAEHIHIIITPTQEADNVIPT